MKVYTKKLWYNSKMQHSLNIRHDRNAEWTRYALDMKRDFFQYVLWYQLSGTVVGIQLTWGAFSSKVGPNPDTISPTGLTIKNGTKYKNIKTNKNTYATYTGDKDAWRKSQPIQSSPFKSYIA